MKVPTFKHIWIVTWTWCVVFIACLAMPAPAQVSTSTMMGFVEDMKEARIQGASIRLINTQTGTENDSKTNEVGAFLLAGILPGSYTLQVERDGFATIQVRGIILNVGDTKNLLIRMKVGQALESVVVDGTQMAVSTTSDSMSTIIDRRTMENTSVEGRSLHQLFQSTPGVIGQSPQALEKNPGTEGDLSVNGQLTQANWYIVDGVSGNFGATYPLSSQQTPSSGLIPASTALGTAHALAPLDSLEEFRVSSSAYAAEYGKTPGGQFALYTRAGTNQFHGSVYDYFRDSSLDANDWFANHLQSGQAASRQNNFGATLGGPLKIPGLDGKAGSDFFFLSYEGVRAQEAIAPTLQYVPSLQVRSAAPATLRAVLNAFPLPTGAEIRNLQDGQLSGLAPFVLKSSLPSSLDAFSTRLDSNLPKQTSAFLRYGYTPSYRKTRDLSSVKLSRIDSQTLTLGVTNQFSSRGVNQFRLGYAVSEASLRSTLDGFGGAAVTDLGRAMGLTGSYSTAQATTYLRMNGVGEAKLEIGNSSNAVHEWDFADTFTFLAGPHLVKAGFDVRRIASPIHPPDLVLEQNFFKKADLQQGIASEMLVTRNLPATPLFHSYSAYAQDDWKVFPRLVLSYGLRWESSLAPSEAHGNLPYSVPQNFAYTQNQFWVPVRRAALWDDLWGQHFAPRAGLSLEMNRKEGWETILRFGTGIFYGSAQQAGAEAFRGLGFTSTNYVQGVSLPATSSDYEISLDPSMAINHTKVFWFKRTKVLPRYINWSVSLEQSLSKRQSLILSCLGTYGTQELLPDINPARTANGGFTELRSYIDAGDDYESEYSSLQLKYKYKTRAGLDVLASYSYAESVGPGVISFTESYPYGNPPPPGAKVLRFGYPSRGYSDLDIRQSAQAAISWQIPKALVPARAKAFAGWAVDARLAARKGFPLSPEQLQLTDLITGDKYHMPAYWNSMLPSYRMGKQYPGGKALNGGSSAPDGAFPDVDSCATIWFCTWAGRNTLRGFGAFQMNMALRKDFHLSERLGLQFRAEVFNVTNHPNFGYIDTDTSHEQFGQAIKMLNQSSGTVSPLYEQGGPRSFQFALRAHF